MGKQFEEIQKKWQEALKNPELNEVRTEIRAALKKAKEDPKNSGLTATVLERGLAGLRDDLSELKISRDEWPDYERIFKERFEMATQGLENQAISESLEAKNLDTFIDDYARYTKLDKVIAECETENSKNPLKKLIRVARANAPLLAGLSAGFIKWLNEGKEALKKAKLSKLDKAAVKADEVLRQSNNKKKDKKPEKKNKTKNKSGSVTAIPVSKKSESAPASAETKAESIGSTDYGIESGNPEKLDPEAFRKKYLKIKNRKDRNTFVLRQVAAGNANNIFEKLKITGKNNMTVEMEVDRSGLRVAGMNVQLDGPTAMAAARLSECTLPTPWLSDQIYKAAQKNRGIIPFIAAPQIAKSLNINWQNLSQNNRDLKRMSAEFAVQRDKLLKKWEKEHPNLKNKLTAGYFKDIVQPVPGKTRSGMLEIFGGYFASGKKVQPLSGGFHGLTYSDYSHQLRRVKDRVTITENGKKTTMSLARFYSNKKYRKAFGINDGMPKKTAYLTSELQKFVRENKAEKKKSA